jgi:DMSO/TMAO reductase YedYZ molybdopterin-dependent catalytic subunit
LAVIALFSIGAPQFSWSANPPVHGPAPALQSAPLAISIVSISGVPLLLTAAQIGKLPTVVANIRLGTEHGPMQASFAGPLLWTVLKQAPAISLSNPTDAAREVVLITGADGYTAVLALAEIAPLFEGKKVLLATQINGKPLLPGHLRIIVPGDQRAGRSVRDVARIAVLPVGATEH